MRDSTDARYHDQERDHLVYTEDFRVETAAVAHRADFPGSDQRDGNDHSGDRRFTSWLKEIDPDAADAYTHRHDLTQYPPEKREAVLAAHVEAFNMSHSPNGQDRLQGATDLSSTIYGPMADRVEAMEAQGQSSWPVSTQGLERHREMFASTLYVSQPDTTYAGMLNKQIEDASAYSQGERVDPAQVEFRTIRNQPDEALQDIAVNNLISQNMNDAFTAAFHQDAAGGPRAEGAREATSAISGIYRDGLNGALADDQEDIFQRVAKRAESHGAELAQEIHHGAGFVHKESYDQPQPPESFTRNDLTSEGSHDADPALIHQAQTYIDQVHTALDRIDWQKGEMNSTYHAAARDLAQDFDRTLETTRDSQGVLDTREDYERMNRLAQGITFLMRPA